MTTDIIYNNMEPYDDIIGESYPRRKTKHPPMPLMDRAAQFAPFAALTGHSDAIRKAQITTVSPLELSETEQQSLSARLIYALELIDSNPLLTLTVFCCNESDNVGKYSLITGKLKKYDEFSHSLILDTMETVRIDDIVDIKGKIFREFPD